MTQPTWTHERVDALRRLIITEGLSAAQAALALGVTKNMVIGRCWRTGITLNPDPRHFLTPSDIEEIRNSTESSRTLARRLGVSDNCVGEVRRGLSHKIKQPCGPTPNPFPDASSCLWGHGHPGSPGFQFCGAPRAPGKPYCAAHAAVCYVPADKVVA